MYKDQLIITGIKEGNEKILGEFYKDNVKYIKRFILNNYGNKEDVEDVFQDALVRLYQKLRSGNFQLQGSLRTYFFGICKNIWRTRLRKKDILIEDHSYFEEEASVIENPIHYMEDQEKEHLYRKHFQRLSSDNKQLLTLFFSGKSMKEISVITGTSLGYTRKKKFDAKNKLLQMIEQDPIYKELRAVC